MNRHEGSNVCLSSVGSKVCSSRQSTLTTSEGSRSMKVEVGTAKNSCKGDVCDNFSLELTCFDEDETHDGEGAVDDEEEESIPEDEDLRRFRAVRVNNMGKVDTSVAPQTLYCLPYQLHQFESDAYIDDFDNSIVSKYVRRRGMRWFLLGMAILCILAVSAAAVYIVGRNEPKPKFTFTDAELGETSLPPQSTSDDFTFGAEGSGSSAIIFLAQVSSADALKDASTPQGKALHWLRDDEDLLHYVEKKDKYSAEAQADMAQMLLERFALGTFFYSTTDTGTGLMTGTTWEDSSDWMTDVHVCDWYGVTCNNDRRVTELHLMNNNLSGSIPKEIGGLSHLTKIDLRGNGLSGTIPMSFGELVHLSDIRLSSNRLEGDLTVEAFGNLNKLEYLYLDDNKIEGAIPYWINLLTSLKVLKLLNNRFIDPIPSHLGQLSNLRELDLSNNYFSGSIPEELGRCTQLRHLRLSNNELNGKIPDLFVELTNLEILALDSNYLQGHIPGWIGVYDEMEMIYLNDNDLTGNIPQELGLMVGVRELTLHGNSVVGKVPSLLCDMGLTTLTADCRNNPNLFCTCCTCFSVAVTARQGSGHV